MPLIKPKLIHPVLCKIENLKDQGDVTYDDDFKEPDEVSDDLYDTANHIEVYAQVTVTEWDAMEAKLNGFDEKARGFIKIYREDLGTIAKNSRIIEIDGVPVDNYIFEIRPVSFYDDGFHFYKLIYQYKESGVNV